MQIVFAAAEMRSVTVLLRFAGPGSSILTRQLHLAAVAKRTFRLQLVFAARFGSRFIPQLVSPAAAKGIFTPELAFTAAAKRICTVSSVFAGAAKRTFKVKLAFAAAAEMSRAAHLRLPAAVKTIFTPELAFAAAPVAGIGDQHQWDNDSVKNWIAFLAAAFFEIFGCYAVWLWLRLGRTPLWLIPGLVSLAFFALVLTRVDSAYAGRAFAAYGGVYIVSSLVWLALIERSRPQLSDLLGTALCLAGAALILFGARAP